LTRKAIKKTISCLFAGNYPIDTPLIWKLRQIDVPLPCKMNPVNGTKWLNEKVEIDLTQEEVKIIIKYAKNDSMAFDLLEELE